jgi:amino acid adenylation domain-containing protein
VQNLPDYLEASAARYPDRPAVVDPGGGSITYAALDRQANALAGFLSTQGVKRGDRVGVVLPKSIAAVTAFFGIMKAGAAYVPVDFTAPIERGRGILQDCHIRALILDGRSLKMIPDPSETPLAAILVVEALPEAASALMTSFETAIQSEGQAIAQAAGPSDLAYILYTSGSTGIPKGVMITHANALSFIEWCSSEFKPNENDRFISHSPFYFDISVLNIYLAVKHGAALYLASDELRKNPGELARFIANHRVTIWSSTPSALNLLVQFGNLGEHDASSLRLVLFGGEEFRAKHLRELKKHWPWPVYYNLYGPTEITVACTFARIPEVIPDDRNTPYPIGFPCSHCRALVLDNERKEVVPGEEGLLYISGPSVCAGYWNRPAENAAVFLNREGARWYNTGDVVRWDPAEGFTYVGRNDRMVKRRGYRIELGDIEHALYLHSQVREAAVVSVPDADAGVKIIAFLSCHDAKRPSIIKLKAFCVDKLPPYMSPDQFLFQDWLPRTSTEKVDYQALQARLLNLEGNTQ